MQGIYLLIIKKEQTSKIKVGKFGEFIFPNGIYLYIGSSLGKNSSTNIENRIKRHFKKEKKLYWHIDYFLADSDVSIIDAFYGITNKKLECDLLKTMKQQNDNIKIIIKNFGSSDCVDNCGSHLLHINSLSLDKIYQYIRISFDTIGLTPKIYEI
ncbi:MAG: GIY-YIG nuclease family protein [Candidatus Helarchaeota archaeon]